MNVTIVGLRYHMKDVLLAIDRGETVTVLYRGKEKAKLVPIASESRVSDKDAPKTKDQPLFGLWRDRPDLTDPVFYLRRLRELRTVFAETSPKKRARADRPK